VVEWGWSCRARFAVLSSFVGLAACVAAPVLVPDTALLPALPRHVDLTGVPFFPQQSDQCGPAALAEVMGYRGIEATPEQLRPRVYVPARGGSLQSEMLAVPRSDGLLAYQIAPLLHDLLREIAAGNPVLVLQDLAFAPFSRWHYAVVTGYDLVAGDLVLRSGEDPRRRLGFTVFDRTWARSGRWAAVFMDAGQLPATAQPLAYLRSASALESVGRASEAYAAYRAATTAWPAERAAWLGFGNTAYRLSNFAIAEQAFKSLIALNPLEPEGWNNLAYGFAAQGCTRAARDAARCAVALSDMPEFRATLHEIERLSDAGASCAVAACPALSGR
jgi:hypothetical protein